MSVNFGPLSRAVKYWRRRLVRRFEVNCAQLRRPGWRRKGTAGVELGVMCCPWFRFVSTPLYGALWGSMGLCRALWDSTVGLINPGHDLVTNSTHLSPASRASPDMVRACIDLMKYNFYLFPGLLSISAKFGKWESEVRMCSNLGQKGQDVNFWLQSCTKSTAVASFQRIICWFAFPTLVDIICCETFEKWKCETFGNGNEHNIAFNFIKSSPDLSECIKATQHSLQFCISRSKAYIQAKM